MDVSVAICTWNRAELLDCTLASLAEVFVPRHVRLRVIVADNNSTDDTARTVERHERRLPLQRLFVKKQGKSNALNAVLERLQGDLVLWTDDDVLFDRHWLTAYVEMCIRDRYSRELQRAERLRATNSQSEFDKIETAHEAAVAELAIGRARVEQAMAAAKQAEINLDRTTIRAPIDGVIIDRRANLGQNVAAGISGLFLLARNLDSMRIRTSVNETDIGKISVGQPVTFTVDSHRDRQLTGRVEKILLNAKLQGNFVTYDVFVVIDGPTTMLMPHMTADVEFETAKREQAWLCLLYTSRCV